MHDMHDTNKLLQQYKKKSDDGEKRVNHGVQPWPLFNVTNDLHRLPPGQ